MSPTGISDYARSLGDALDKRHAISRNTLLMVFTGGQPRTLRNALPRAIQSRDSMRRTSIGQHRLSWLRRADIRVVFSSVRPV